MDQATIKKSIFNFGMVLGLQSFSEKNAKEVHYGLLNIFCWLLKTALNTVFVTTTKAVSGELGAGITVLSVS